MILHQTATFQKLKASTLWYGFSHRLDVPSVGLILTTKTHEDYYDLRLQLSVGYIARDRIVCCHRWLLCHQCDVTARAMCSKVGATHSGPQSMPCCTRLGFWRMPTTRFRAMHCTLETRSVEMAGDLHQSSLSRTSSCVPGTSYTVIPLPSTTVLEQLMKFWCLYPWTL